MQPDGLLSKPRIAHRPPQTASPAHHPLAQAHWKLYPPSQPVTSTASPITNSPGTAFAAIVRDDRSRVSTPPHVTSALANPSVPVGVTVQRDSRAATAASARSGTSANRFPSASG